MKLQSDNSSREKLQVRKGGLPPPDFAIQYRSR